MSFLSSLLLLTSLVRAAPQGLPGGFDNADATGNPVPPSGASGNIYPTNAVLGPTSALPEAATATTLDVGPFTLVPGQDANPTYGLYLDFKDTANPQPLRGDNGATDPGPRNYEIDRQNSDLLARPGTDSGDVPNSKWPMGLSSARSGIGRNSGWARQQNTNELPVASMMAGVDMRLAPNAYRELHWHQASEWAYVFNGSARITAVNQIGQTYVDDIEAGDLWFFPAGVPHSIQATEAGVEFLLIFNQGDFSEDGTDLVSELFARNPREVLARNFQADIEEFDDIPEEQLYIFNGTPMGDLEEEREEVTGPAGRVPLEESYTYHFSQQEPLTVPGGTVKIVDPTVFPIANNFSAALFTIEPGAMREMHWHLTSDEWNFIIAGQGRLTSFVAPSSSRTFDFQAGDVGYVPVANGHYLENTGNETLVFLEMLLEPKFQDISVGQWLGLTPKRIVRDHLKLPQRVLDSLPKTKRYLVPGPANYTTTNFTVPSYPNAARKRDLEPRVYTKNVELKFLDTV